MFTARLLKLAKEFVGAFAAADIDAYSGMFLMLLHTFGPVGEHLGGQIVGAEEAEILQRMQRCTLAGTGEAGDHHQHNCVTHADLFMVRLRIIFGATLTDAFFQRFGKCLVAIQTTLFE